MPLTRELLEGTFSLSYEGLKDEVVRQAKNAILDFAGCAIGGATVDYGKITVDVVRGLNAPAESSVLGAGYRTLCNLAAFANGETSDALDFGDTYKNMGHPGAAVISSTLAMAEKVRSSGKGFITAVVIGYEVACRVGFAIQPSPQRHRQVWGMGTWESLGCAAAASKLLGLDLEKAVWAVGIAGSSTPVPSLRKTVHNKHGVFSAKNQFGWAAEVGIWAALLASKGFTGPPDILEGDDGFWAIAGSDRFDENSVLADLGKRFAITELSFKPYPCCRWNQFAVEAVKRALKDVSVDPLGVKSITIKMPSRMIGFPHSNKEPKTMTDAEFSVPYSVAIAILNVPPGLLWYTKEQLDDRTLRSLIEKVVFEADEEADKEFPEKITVSVSIQTDDEVYSATVSDPKGEPTNPMSDEELREKFLGLANPVIGEKNSKEAVTMLERLEQLDDVNKWTRYLLG